jgi:hypothetical protein
MRRWTPLRLLWAVILGPVVVLTYVFFGLYILLALLALNLVAAILAPFARHYGWGSEGRLMRHLNRPAFDDPQRRRGVNS